jgi:hypothetical protein
MVSVAGGKLTTHRRIALDALRHLPDRVRPRRLFLSDAPLPGASPVRDLNTRHDGSMVDHLLHLYGSETGKLLGYSKVKDNALERMTPGAPDLWPPRTSSTAEPLLVCAASIRQRSGRGSPWFSKTGPAPKSRHPDFSSLL